MGIRAMTEAAKKQKAQAILDCAAQMFLAADYDAVKMSAVARAMRLSNGILFVYFPTKQTLFLSLLMREYHARIDALERLAQPRPVTDYQTLCELILADLAVQLENTLYIRLEAIRAAILEKNVEPALVLALKAELFGRMLALAERFAVPGVITAREILEIFHVQTALIAGFQFASDIPAPLREQFLQNGLEAFVHDPKQDTLHAMRLYLSALKEKSGR